MESLKTIYVSGDGTGDFNCDGKDDHIEINKAFAFVHDNPEYNTVYLKGNFTYVISKQLKIYTNTIFTGDKTAVLKLCDNCTLPKDAAILTQATITKSNPGTVIIRGFEYNGNSDGNKSIPTGKSYFTFAWIFYDNVVVEDMYFHHTNNDCVKVKYSNSIVFKNNKIYKMGHEGLYAIDCKNIEFSGNNVRQRTNSAVRLQNSNHAKIFNNEIYTEYEGDAGGPGIQIQYTDSSFPMDDIEVFNNNIHDTYGPGMWIITTGGAYNKTDACNVYIHDNVFKDCGTHPSYNWLGGIVTSGFYDLRVENNTFDGNYGFGLVWMYPADGRFSGLAPKGTSKPYNVYMKGNKICNTKLRKGSTAGGISSDKSQTGQGLANYYPGLAQIVSEENWIWDNTGGAYKNVTSTTDKYIAPDVEPDQEPEDNMNTANRLRSATPTAAYPAPVFIDVGGLSGKKYRALLHFNVKEKTCESATLELNWYFPAQARKQDSVIEVYLADSYSPEFATWATSADKYYDMNGVLGGNVPFATFTIKASELPRNEYIDFDVTKLVRIALAEGQQSVDILLKTKGELDDYVAFKTFTEASSAPLLTVEEVPPVEYLPLSCATCEGNQWALFSDSEGIKQKRNCLKCGSEIFL